MKLPIFAIIDAKPMVENMSEFLLKSFKSFLADNSHIVIH